MRTLNPTPAELESEICELLGLDETTKKEFLFPEYTLGNIFDFIDMEKAVERIYMAVKNKEEIGVYADYDCDGIPGAVILTDFFEHIGALEKVHVYIPDRHDEGYGLSMLGITELTTQGVTLLITVDLGITAIAEVAFAQSNGIDIIVTDHHAPIGTTSAELPDAFALLHPIKSTYKNTEPCGAAVAFYLICAFLKTYGEEFGVTAGWEKWLLDLVGFATLSDMMPLRGENRMLAAYGLVVMRKTRRLGLRTLLAKNNVSIAYLTEQDLTFTVAPRLNAASRMDTPLLAYKLLRTTDQSEAETLVKRLEEINAERKTLVARIVKESHTALAARTLRPIVVIGNPEWRPAVLGLVATKLCEQYGKSFFVWGEGGDGTIKGSCRVLPIHHAAHLLQRVPQGRLLHAGGHQAAGGFSMHKEYIHFFEDDLNAVIQDTGTEMKEIETRSMALPLASATVRHLNVVRRFAPFGMGNTEPLFLFEGVEVMTTKEFGKHKEHLECSIHDMTGSATAFTFFVHDDMKEKIAEGKTISILGTLEAGWRGGARIRIKEIV